jgi:hypothetical protein
VSLKQLVLLHESWYPFGAGTYGMIPFDTAIAENLWHLAEGSGKNNKLLL